MSRVCREADVVVNGRILSEAEVMTVRMALIWFNINLGANGLGEDEHGKATCSGYQAACHSVVTKMMTRGDKP